MNKQALKFAPREIFEEILKYAVIPTFDLIVHVRSEGVLLFRRRIAPYRNQWALPGLRMMKPEGIYDTLRRIAQAEIGLGINPENSVLIGQYVGKFSSEFKRQDISTCYAVTTLSFQIILNQSHFTGFRFLRKRDDIPRSTGAMYRNYLNIYFDRFCDLLAAD